MTDKPNNGSVNVAALYALIGQLTVENRMLKAQLEQASKSLPQVKVKDGMEAEATN